MRIPLGETESTIVKQTYCVKNIFCKVKTLFKFLFKLFGTENVVSLGNSELADADKTVHFAAVLVSEKGGGLRKSHRKIAVGAGSVQKYLILERTSHRTERKAFLGFVVGVAEDEHTVQIVIPVSRNFVKLPLCHVGSFCKLTAAFRFNVLYPPLEYLNNSRALWQQNRKSLTDIVNGCKVFQLTSQLVVVAFFGFFGGFKVFLKLTCLGVRRTVYTGKLLALGVSPPVCAGAGCKLKRLYSTRTHQMRTCAKVGEVSLFVEAYVLAFVCVLSTKLHLVGLAHFFKHSLCLVGRQTKLFNGYVLLDYLFHFGFKRGQIVGGERLFGVEIIVKASLDSGTYSKLDIGVQSLNSLRQNV